MFHSRSLSIICLRLALTAVLLGTGLAAHAQIGEPRNNFAVGANVGLTMNTVGFDPTIKQSMLMAPTFGVTARITSEKYFTMVCALQVELNYATLGWKEDIIDANTNPLPDQYERQLHYLQLPLLARLGWGREKKGVMGYIVAGPQVGFMLSETTKQSEFTLTEEGVPNRPNGMVAQYSMPIDRKLDYGITGGAGIELSTKAGHFLLEGRYYYGLGDIYNNSKKDVFSRSNHGTIIVKFTYLFDINKNKNK